MTDNQVDSIEEVARRRQAGTDTHEHLMDVFVRNIVYLPSVTNPLEGVSPILTKVDGIEYVVVGSTFKSLSRADGMMHFVATMAGWQVLAGVHPDDGVMVMFGENAFSIEPWEAAELRSKYGIKSLTDGSSSSTWEDQ